MSLPTLRQDPRALAFVQDPYPLYDQIRAHPFMEWVDLGLPVTARADLVSAILRDRRFGRVPPGGHPPSPPTRAPFDALDRAGMLESEPPDHTRLRGLVLRAFTPSRVASLAPWITQKAEALLAASGPGPFDLIARFAEPLPVAVIAHMMGVPQARAQDLRAWSAAMVAMYQPAPNTDVTARAVAASAAFAAYLDGLIEARASKPGDDLLSALVSAHLGDATLTRQEVVANAILLLNAGHEATVHGITNGVKALLQSGLYGAPATPELVEEVLRFDPPLHLFTRHVCAPATLGGHAFAPGDQVGVLLGGAARDPALFDAPGAFQHDRTPCPHLSFGAGLHFCVGAALARLEMRIAFEVLTRLRPGLRLSAAPVYADRWHFRGLTALWVEG